MSLARLSIGEIAPIVERWRRETRELGRRSEVKQVFIFENKGAVVGVSNPHPHGQIYATNFTWKTFDTELVAQQRYARDTGRSLFADIIEAEQRDGRRVLFDDEHTIAFVPYFARYAYEVYVAPKRRVPHVFDLSDAESESLARALKAVTVRLDNLWRQSFPYVMPLHQAPTDGGDYRDFHFFIGFLPPLRRANTLKYLAGPEIGAGNFLSDTSPEEKAAELRAQSTIHYREPPA
jgi:UDPglucose--hexose-1-phosphate uridylyltransferase